MRANHRRRLVVILIALFALIGLFTASAVARPGLGTVDAPVMLSIVDGVAVDAVEEMARALEIATGLHFDVESVEVGQPGIEWLCDEFPDRGLRIMAAIEYVVAKKDCGAHTSMALKRFGLDWMGSEFLVPDDSELYSLADLADLDWYYSNEGSLTGYWAPLHMLNEAGVDGYTPIPALDPDWDGSHTAAVKAVYDNAVDPANPEPVFATVYVDARGEIFGVHPDVFAQVRVLEESPPIPFDVAAFGPRFPDGLRHQIESLMQGFSHETHPAHWVWEDSLGHVYSSDGWVKVNWADFHFLKDVMTSTGFEF